MKASEARKIATNTLDISDISQHDNIIERIIKAAHNGFFYIWYYEQPSERVLNILTEEGYVFTNEGYHRNEYIIKINW